MRASVRRLVFGFLLFLGLLTVFVPRVMAQTSFPFTDNVGKITMTEEGANSQIPANLHNGTQLILLEALSAVGCQLTGYDYLNPHQGCLGLDPITSKIGFVSGGGGVIGSLVNLTSLTFTAPASSTQYFAYMKSNFGIAKPTYAADTTGDCSNGIGFCQLKPIMSLWIVMRNFTYLLFIVIFVLIGLLIMLRVHIDPRTVMTVQNAIPKLIIGIVLVTFSFAISGFLIDVMYTASYLLGSVIQESNQRNVNFTDVIASNDVFEAAGRAYNGGLFAIASDGANNFSNLITGVIFGPGQDPSKCAQAGEQASEFDRFCNVDFIGGILRALVGALIGLIAFIIIAIAVIYTLIKLFIIMVLAYINILLDIVFAPFWFLLGVLPGSESGFGAWFKDMIANLAVYPAVIVMLMLANVFSHIFQNMDGNTEMFVPPVLGNPVNAQALAGIVALGFFFMLPSVLTIMKAALKAPKVDFGPVFQPAGQAFGTIKSTAQGAFIYKKGSYPNPEEKGLGAVFRRTIMG